MFKRAAGNTITAVALQNSKKPRMDLVSSVNNDSDISYLQSGKMSRTSSLYAPIMLLTGHENEVFCAKFSPDGQFLASAGFDRVVYLWSTYDENCENIAVLKGHGGAILDIHLTSDGASLYTACTNNMLSLWDLTTCTRIKNIKGHNGVVNSCCVARRGPQIMCSGSDDGTVKLWDRRKREAVHTFECTYQTLSVCFNDTSEMIFSAGIDNLIKAWDLRRMDIAYKMRGHQDTITGISLSLDGGALLSNSMDNTLRIWDVKPYAPIDRCTKILQGHMHGIEKNLLRCAWSPSGRRVTCGSSDRFVYIWDVNSRQILYKLPGHAGCVNETGFHPSEPIIVSAGSDKKVYLGEIENDIVTRY